jgi:pimeloyl-ACP methyl ester carboxylesterase
VLIQGLGFDRSGWAPVTPALRRRFRLVLIDNRGSGRSTVPDQAFTVADMAGDVAAVLDRSRIGRAHVIGTSLGGMVAQELAIEHPERVNRLILACTTPGWPFAYPMPNASLKRMTAAANLPPEAAVRMLVENALSPRTVENHPELVERLIGHHRTRPVDPAGWKALLKAGAAYSGGMRQTLIRAPTLIVYGDADAVVDPRNSKLLADRIPDSRVVVFPELGHLFFWEDAAGFAQAVTSFLLSPAEKAAEKEAGGETHPVTAEH